MSIITSISVSYSMNIIAIKPSISVSCSVSIIAIIPMISVHEYHSIDVNITEEVGRK